MRFRATASRGDARTTMTRIPATLALAFAAACKSSPPEPPPPQPPTGAPMAFVASNVKPGDDYKGSFDLKAYNFSDKTIAQYGLLMRYHDASGAVLKVKPGTPFEATYDHWSMSGQDYACKPKSWCTLRVKHVMVPDKATSVDVLASRLAAVAADGLHFEEPDLFDLKDMGWPESVK
jgi:hypothetical protein